MGYFSLHKIDGGSQKTFKSILILKVQFLYNPPVKRSTVKLK